MSPRPLRTFSLQALSHENIKGPKMNKLENNLYGQKSSTNQGGGGLEKQCDGPSVLQRYDGDD